MKQHTFDHCSLSCTSSTVHQIIEKKAAEYPAHPFLTYRDHVWTLGDINRAANRLAWGLMNLGVKPGDRIAVMMTGSMESIITWFAISKTGAIEVPVNTAYMGDMLAYILRLADVRMIVADEDFEVLIGEVLVNLSGIERIIINRADRSTGTDTLYGIMAADENDPGLDITAFDPSCIILTSGTTGPSKGVVISHGHQVSFAMFFNEIAAMSPNDVGYNYLPFFHIAAKFLTLGSMLVDGRMVLEPVFSISRFWEDVHRHNVTICIAVGGLIHMLNSQAIRLEDRDNTLRLIYCVPIPSELQQEFEKRFGVKLIEGYGATESNIVVYSRHGETPPGSCGRASPYFEIAILNDIGDHVPSNSSGEICVRPKLPNTLMSGYLDMPEKTLEAFRDLWFHSGDRGYMDEDGFVYFQDRLTDSIRRRGENISSYEVERLINMHEDVVETAVVAVPAEVGEDDIKAVVIRRSGSSLDYENLLTFCAETMPYFMIPRYICFREELPRTPTHKVQKVVLREEGVCEDHWDREAAGLSVTRDGLRRVCDHEITDD